MGDFHYIPTKPIGHAAAGLASARRARQLTTGLASAALAFAALCLLLPGPCAAQAPTPTPGPDARPNGSPGTHALDDHSNGRTARGDSRPEPDAGGASENPNVGALLSQTDARGAEMHRRLLDYTYTLKKVRRELNDRGGTKEEEADTFEAYPIRGEHLLVRISKNGRESPGWLVERERQNVGRALQQLEEATAKDAAAAAAIAAQPRWMAVGVGGRVHGKPVYIVVDPAEFLHSCEFHTQRRERVAGRDTIILDFRPRPGASLPPSKSYLSTLIGTIWIDVADLAIVRIEARPAAAALNASPVADAQAARASLVLYQQTRLPSGVWAPTLIRINSGGDAALFGGLNWDVVLEFSEYKEFSTGIQSIEFPPPAAPARP